ncbi:MAG: restriction endonuclease subunit S [Aeromicrobium sp.]|uniref:restriction endonuclease subunit S n=1 Tax=Aeromicrobium sp. TaxID=1871063 RepID=UPI002624BC42|nr:restriction endonuclease subunit S [Aeromicrobium sp.]MDF1705335.1 restriction endonuclease subunit S [Aeromicrobium sp.]
MTAASVPLLETVRDVSAGNAKIPRSKLMPAGPLAVVDQGQSLVAGFTDDETAAVKAATPLIVFGDHTRALKYIDFPFAMGADGVKVLQVQKGFDPKFVFHYLRSRNIPSAGYSRHFKFLQQIAVPRPAMSEQRRIAAILDLADALRARRRRILVSLDSLARSIFEDIVGGDYWRSVSPSATGPNDAGWSWVPLSDISRLATGHTPDRKRPDYWDGGKIPWISLPEIRSLDGQTAIRANLAITEAGLANSSAVLLPVGTVCFSRTASVGFVTKLGVPMATSQDFHNWVPGPDLDSEYLMSALRYSRRHLLSVSDGSIHRTIYQRTAQTFRVLLPPLDLQHEFAERSRSVAAQRVLVQRGLATGDDLFASLQTRAFRGEL